MAVNRSHAARTLSSPPGTQGPFHKRILPSPCPRSHSAGPKPRPRCSNETLLDRALIKSGPSID